MAQKTQVISLRLESDLFTALQLIAKREDTSTAFIIRRALRKGLNLPMPSKEADPIKLPESWE